MPETEMIIPLRDLIELHRHGNFPLRHIYVQFKDYDWLSKFFEECFRKLVEKGKIQFKKGAGDTVSFSLIGDELKQKEAHMAKYFPGIKILSKYISNKIGLQINLFDLLGNKASVSVSVFEALFDQCGFRLEDIQGQITKMTFGHGGQGGTIGLSFAIIYTLHNSDEALFQSQLNSIIQIPHTHKRIGETTRLLCKYGYLVAHGSGTFHRYTLRGEERKFKK